MIRAAFSISTRRCRSFSLRTLVSQCIARAGFGAKAVPNVPRAMTRRPGIICSQKRTASLQYHKIRHRPPSRLETLSAESFANQIAYSQRLRNDGHARTRKPLDLQIVSLQGSGFGRSAAIDGRVSIRAVCDKIEDCLGYFWPELYCSGGVHAHSRAKAHCFARAILLPIVNDLCLCCARPARTIESRLTELTNHFVIALWRRYSAHLRRAWPAIQPCLP